MIHVSIFHTNGLKSNNLSWVVKLVSMSRWDKLTRTFCASGIITLACSLKTTINRVNLPNNKCFMFYSISFWVSSLGARAKKFNGFLFLYMHVVLFLWLGCSAWRSYANIAITYTILSLKIINWPLPSLQYLQATGYLLKTKHFQSTLSLKFVLWLEQSTTYNLKILCGWWCLGLPDASLIFTDQALNNRHWVESFFLPKRKQCNNPVGQGFNLDCLVPSR